MTEISARSASSPPIPVLDIAAVLTMLAVFALTMGYTYPAVAFNLEARGFSPSVIGAQSALAGLGILVSAVVLPQLAVRIGTWRLAVFSLYGTAVILLAFGLSENIVLWFALRFVLGCMVNVLFVVSEIWINTLAPDGARGRIISIYAASIAGLFALGPMLIPVIGFTGLSSFGVLAIVVVLMGLPLLRLRQVARPLEPAPLSVSVQVVLAIPVLLLGVTAFGYLDGATLALWVVYALFRDLDPTAAAVTLSALIIGNVLLQFPIGWLADRMSRRTLLAILAALGFVGAAFLPWVELWTWWGLGYLVIWGAAAFGVYTLALTLIGQHLTGTRLVAANAAFGVAWGSGALAGSAVTGTLMDAFGPGMLTVAIAAVYSLLALATLCLPPIRESLARLDPA